MKGDTYDFESPGWDWIAIKPLVAEAAWAGTSARMVFFGGETIKELSRLKAFEWTDSSVQHHSSSQEVEVAEGGPSDLFKCCL